MKSIKDLEAIRQRTLDDINLRNDHAQHPRGGGHGYLRHRGRRPPCDDGLCGGDRSAAAFRMSLVTQTGCIGVCRLEPMVEVYVPGQEKVTYVQMTPEKVARVVGRTPGQRQSCDRIHHRRSGVNSPVLYGCKK